MSVNACWNCGLLGHHRRDCTRVLEEGSAALNKKESHAAHAALVGKSPAEKQKWADKLSARGEPPMPQVLLKKFVEKSLDYLTEKRDQYHSIATPSYDRAEIQLRAAEIRKEGLRLQLGQMREVSTQTKNYLIKGKKMNSDDDILATKVEDLDTLRQPLLTDYSQLIANLKEIIRQKPEIQRHMQSIRLDLDNCEGRLGERSPSLSALDFLGEKLLEVKMSVAECEGRVRSVMALCDATPIVDELGELEERMKNLSILRKDMQKQAIKDMEQLSEAVLCPICMDQMREYVLKCGHQVCGVCIQSLDPAICPFCRKRAIVGVEIFYN